MAQDTRKDPRAKVLSMTVRYKSATVDEFIEHHSHDVSRGGIYIKTPSPFPPGTLLKFEIRIQDEQSVLSGVGRVVWKREPGQATTESPAGMGVKFIKIDEKSKSVISKLVDAQDGKVSAFDRGQTEASNGSGNGGATAPSARDAAAAQKRVSTMLGLGAIGKSDSLRPAAPSTPPEDGGFFPKSNGQSEERPPEERTVMKQAAELLQQALSEAGGSLEEVGGNEPQKVVEGRSEPIVEAKPLPVDAQPAPAPKPVVPAEPVTAPVLAKEPPKVDAPAPKAKPVDDDEAPTRVEPASKPKPKAEPVAEASDDVAIPPPPPKPKFDDLPVSSRALVEPEEKSGKGKLILIGLAAAAVLGGGYVFIQNQPGENPTLAPSYSVRISTSEPPFTASPPTTQAAPPQTAEPTPTPTAVETATPTPPTTAVPTPPATATPTPPTPPATAAPKPPTPPATAAPKPPTPPATSTPKPPKPPKGDDDIYG